MLSCVIYSFYFLHLPNMATRGPASLSWLLTEVILSRTEEFYNLLKGKKLVKKMIRPRY